MPNPNYVASNPGGIPKSQISLRSTPTTTAGADNLTLLSFISLCGQTGTNYSRAPFSPTLFPPSFSASCSEPTLPLPATNNITQFFPLKIIFLGGCIRSFVALSESFCKYCFRKVGNVSLLCCTVNTSSARTHCHPYYCIMALNL